MDSSESVLGGRWVLVGEVDGGSVRVEKESGRQVGRYCLSYDISSNAPLCRGGIKLCFNDRQDGQAGRQRGRQTDMYFYVISSPVSA